jgi:hypothetical protein
MRIHPDALSFRAAFVLPLCAVAIAAGVSPVTSEAKPKPKSQIAGLVDMGSQAVNRVSQPFPTVNTAEVAPVAAAFSGIVVNASWSQLEPARGHYAFGVLKRSVAAVRAYNRAHHAHPLLIKLRVFGGFAAPAWAKALGGPPVTLPSKTLASGSGTVGRWWTVRYRPAWSELQHKLAERYDSERLIHSVAVSSCSSLSAEPFVMPVGQAGLVPLLAAGFTSAAQRRCLEGAFADYSGWSSTPIDYAFNPFPSIAPGTKFAKADLSVTKTVMARCANLLSQTGRSCILSNHGLQTGSATTSRSAVLYAEINTLYARHHGTPVDFQTLSPNTFGGCAAIQLAVRHHAQSVELWPPAPRGGFHGYRAFSAPALVSWSRALQTHTGPRC